MIGGFFIMKEIVILTVSDIHGYIFPTDYQEAHQDLPKGLLKINQMIQDIKKTHEHVIVMDNGDFLQGSPLCSYLASEAKSSKPLTDLYNQIDFDFGVIGNHEFNYGLPYLYDAIKSLNYPVLSANIFKDHQPFTGNDVIYLEKDKTTFGIIGLTTQYIPHWEKPDTIAELSFQSAVESAKELIPEVRRNADIVVVCYHGGFERDLHTGEETELLTGENEGYALLTELEGVDVLITGHQHREIAEVINQTAVIQPGGKGDCLGKITLKIDDETNKVLSADSELLFVKDYQPQISIPQNLTNLEKEINDWLDTEISQQSQTMYVDDHFKARIKPHPLINFINYAQMKLSGADISASALFDSGVGFGQTITMRDVINNYPFPNTFYVLDITGKDLLLALERTASYFDIEQGELVVNKAFIEPKPQHYNYDMYAGISYTFNIQKPIGNRVENVLFKGKPIELDKHYSIVLNNYRAVGGGDFNMYSADKIIKDIQVEGAEMLIDFLEQHSIEDVPEVMNFEVKY